MMDDMKEMVVKGSDKKSIPWDRLLGVAVLGAVGSALLYYVFTQLDEEHKQALKETVITFGKSAMAKMTHGDAEA